MMPDCALTGQCLDECRVTASRRDDAVSARRLRQQTPWTRDLCYMVEGAAALLDPTEVLAAIDYLLAAQRKDGRSDVGRPTGPRSTGGPVDNPLGVRARGQPTVHREGHGWLCAPPGDIIAFIARRNALPGRWVGALSHDGLILSTPTAPTRAMGSRIVWPRRATICSARALLGGLSASGEAVRAGEYHDGALSGTNARHRAA